MSSPIEAYRRMAQWIATKYRMVDPKDFGTALDLTAKVSNPLVAPTDADFGHLVTDLSMTVVGDRAFPVRIDASAVLSMICENINAPQILHTTADFVTGAKVNATVCSARLKALDATFQGIVTELCCEIEGEQNGTGNIAADIGEVGAQVRIIVQQVLATLVATDYAVATAFGLDSLASALAEAISPDVQFNADLNCECGFITELGVNALDGTAVELECDLGAKVYHLWGEYVNMPENEFANLIEKEVVMTEI